MKYIGYEQLEGQPNIIVDGKPNKDSVLILSHWRDSRTPKDWIRDTSAEMVIDYLKEHGLPDTANIVSNCHFDEDGLIGIFALKTHLFTLLRIHKWRLPSMANRQHYYQKNCSISVERKLEMDALTKEHECL